MGAVLKKLPCKLDQAEELIPYLQPGNRVAISDDSSGVPSYDSDRLFI